MILLLSRFHVGDDSILVVVDVVILFFFFKQKTAYEMRISDWSLDVCSSDLLLRDWRRHHRTVRISVFGQKVKARGHGLCGARRHRPPCRLGGLSQIGP